MKPPTKARQPRKVEHGRVIHDRGGRYQGSENDPSLAPIHDIVDMVAQAAGAGLTVQGGGIGIGRADVGVGLTCLFGLGSAVE